MVLRNLALHGGREARWIDHHAVDLHIMAMGQLMQSKGGLHGAGSALRILSGIDRFLGQFQRKERLLGDAVGHGEGEVRKAFRRHDVIDHAQLFSVLGAEPIGGEQHFLGLA